jgi:hypothetical protein
MNMDFGYFRETLLLLLLILLVSCSTGKDSILFVTKTSLGVDIDSKSPTLDIGYTRKEMTLAPQFEEGQVLPQMASFSSNEGIAVNTALGQSFAVGNAAILLSKYLGSTARPKPEKIIASSEITARPYSAEGTLTKAKRYVFATDTSFALKVTFGLETGGYPDSFSLGYKRKELAYVPLFIKQESGKDVVKLPSLIATAAMYMDKSSLRESELRYSQFYATGLAANYLASQPIVREGIARKILTDEEVDKRIQIELNKELTEETVALAPRHHKLLEKIDELSADDTKQLAANPPTITDQYKKMLAVLDPSNKRLTDEKAGKNFLKTILLKASTTESDVEIWEHALNTK